jgi:hypothetical protein
MTVTLLGGEMLLWSDLDATHGPVPAGGAASRPLLAAVSGRTLVAGPHAPELIDALPAEQITVLVRGLADAEALHARYAGRPGVTVWCGSLEKVAAVPAYDTVVALDGLDRLRSAEADELPWDETLAELVSVLRPGGRLLLGAENLFGLHRLVALPPALADTDWVVPDDHDPSRPAGPAALRERLAAAGVPVLRDFAAYPSPAAPSVLLGPAVLAEPELSGFVGATLTTACATATAALADPVRLAVGAARHGLATDLAPAWIVLARREAAQRDPAQPEAARPEAARPEAARPEAAGPEAARPEAAGPDFGAAGADLWPDAVVATGGTVREIRLVADDLPRGRGLAALLLGACQRRDLPALRELLTAWQDGPAAGVPADRVVVAADGRFTGLAPAGEPLAALRHLAAMVINGGYAHLWPGPAAEPELTVLLAGMTGRELEVAEVPPAEPAVPDGSGSVRELTMARDRLARELAEARAKHEWYERMLATREAELKRVRQINAVLSATVPGRAATTLVGGLRAGKRAMRAVVRRARS